MKYFEVGETIQKTQISNETWEFKVSDIFHLTNSEYATNEAFNYTLGDYEPEKELPTYPYVEITAKSKTGETVKLIWLPYDKILSPHISKDGWSKGLFTGLKGKLINWKLRNKSA